MPVHGRAGLLDIVLDQRLALMADLAALGVRAEMVVVGDEDNLLGMARERGFHTVRCPNPLGRRINVGFEFAFRDLEADYAVYNGSDSWLLPEPLADLPGTGRVRSSRELALFSPSEMISIPAKPPVGRAPWTIGRDLMARSAFRPAPNGKRVGLDGALLSAVMGVDPDAFFCPPGDDPLRAVDFRRGPWTEQMTPWERLVGRRADRWRDPWGRLAESYPAQLVERMQRYYAEGT